jgi:hypothetical protein
MYMITWCYRGAPGAVCPEEGEATES